MAELKFEPRIFCLQSHIRILAFKWIFNWCAQIIKWAHPCNLQTDQEIESSLPVPQKPLCSLQSLSISNVYVLRPTLCDLIHCSPPGSSSHGILQARILKWVAMASSRGSSWPRDQSLASSASYITVEFLPLSHGGEVPNMCHTKLNCKTEQNFL